MLQGAKKDAPSVTPEWEPVGPMIDGVLIREVRNIVTANGITTELYREDWKLPLRSVRHAIHVTLNPRQVSAWHCHGKQTDIVFAIAGALRLVLYDGREGSPTFGQVSAFNLSLYRPRLVAVPPLVWHGVQNLAAEPAAFIDYFDQAYDYGDPDEWRLPPDTDRIPYRFS
jgi:dTDP-4-dehydrorhamnose 3,5-epimerase